jgi:Diacylglycerol kinase catalytic domain
VKDGDRRADLVRRTVGRGEGVAVLFNGQAKQVTYDVVHAMRKALPAALVLVSEDLPQAERHTRLILEAKPSLVISGGGDGAATRLLNLLRPLLGPTEQFPVVGMLRLGTGNAWARSSGSERYARAVARLPHLPWPVPTARFNLVAVEGILCPFAGVGWDARILNDYQRNLDRRSSQIFGSRIFTRLHKGLGGYLYSLFRYTVPRELAEMRTGQPQLRVECLSGPAFRVDSAGRSTASEDGVLYEGPVSHAAAAVCVEYGYGIRAFPFAGQMPGFINLRIYDRSPIDALRYAKQLWTGLPAPGLHDFFVKRARMSFSRPVPFEVGGDAHGERTLIDFAVADRTLEVLRWSANT